MKSSESDVVVSHTPTPWKFTASDHIVGITVWRSDGDGVNYRRICRNVSTPADAEFIVKAVNCHDDLLEACKLVDRAFCGDGVQMSTAVDACLMAIAKVTTTPQKEGAK